jgi:hypothetical protein
MTAKTETPDDVKAWLHAALEKIWPVAEGSLSLRKGRCIRKNCKACQTGRGHSSYALYGKRDGKRFSIYVPRDLVPQVEKALENGRRFQELVNEAGIRFLRASKQRATAKSRD